MRTLYCFVRNKNWRRPPFTLAVATLAAVLVAAGGCKKDKEEVFPQFPPPTWENQVTGQYTYSMTAVVTLPRELQSTWQAADELAAFIGEECRAVAEPVEAGGVRVFYLLIQGDATETEKITFRYYNTTNSYIYVSDNSLQFNPEGIYGTVDQPRALVMKPRK